MYELNYKNPQKLEQQNAQNHVGSNLPSKMAKYVKGRRSCIHQDSS